MVYQKNLMNLAATCFTRNKYPISNRWILVIVCLQGMNCETFPTIFAFCALALSCLVATLAGKGQRCPVAVWQPWGFNCRGECCLATLATVVKRVRMGLMEVLEFDYPLLIWHWNDFSTLGHSLFPVVRPISSTETIGTSIVSKYKSLTLEWQSFTASFSSNFIQIFMQKNIFFMHEMQGASNFHSFKLCKKTKLHNLKVLSWRIVWTKIRRLFEQNFLLFFFHL